MNLCWNIIAAVLEGNSLLGLRIYIPIWGFLAWLDSWLSRLHGFYGSFFKAYYWAVWEIKMHLTVAASRIAISQKPQPHTFATNNNVEGHWSSCLYDYFNLIIVLFSQWISWVQNINELHVGQQTFPWKVSISTVVRMEEWISPSVCVQGWIMWYLFVL